MLLSLLSGPSAVNRAPVDAVKNGRATLITTYTRRGSETEQKRADDFAWNKAWREGPEAVLEYFGL